ncbi:MULTISPECIES: hypothetical protein [Bacteroides]|uniref:Uncharacterized protein n=1 Tax=Bacteroides fragilis 3_1_12 TaxID=457424 RepID=A0ABN0BQ11_BACFG|nr:hypothetical protein [Bacteroides fragilis]EFR54953.1 hypothetical protein BFAG_03651 [Bacteroides fragilis 3_1_12]MCZ2694807.1 hypothetical protein [Bacteroides fragilis]
MDLHTEEKAGKYNLLIINIIKTMVQLRIGRMNHRTMHRWFN